MCWRLGSFGSSLLWWRKLAKLGKATNDGDIVYIWEATTKETVADVWETVKFIFGTARAK